MTTRELAAVARSARLLTRELTAPEVSELLALARCLASYGCSKGGDYPCQDKKKNPTKADLCGSCHASLVLNQIYGNFHPEAR